jgi:hypothetical protein
MEGGESSCSRIALTTELSCINPVESSPGKTSQFLSSALPGLFSLLDQSSVDPDVLKLCETKKSLPRRDSTSSINNNAKTYGSTRKVSPMEIMKMHGVGGKRQEVKSEVQTTTTTTAPYSLSTGGFTIHRGIDKRVKARLAAKAYAQSTRQSLNLSKRSGSKVKMINLNSNKKR